MRFMFLALVFFMFAFSFFSKKDECTDEQLHEVISAVEQCKKDRVVCSERMKNQIIKDVCGDK